MRLLWMILPLLGFANPFFLIGTWKIEKKNIEFMIDHDNIISHNHEIGSIVRMRPHTIQIKNGVYHIALHDLIIEKKPNDWYNIYKYSKYIRFMEDIKKYGIHARIYTENDDIIRVYTVINNDALPSFRMIRS